MNLLCNASHASFAVLARAVAPIRLWLSIVVIGLSIGCSDGASTPTGPSSARMSSETSQLGKPVNAASEHAAFEAVFDNVVSRPAAVAFPQRNESVQFRTALETKYRDGLRRSPAPTYVDQEGSVVWTVEYLRYRMSLCSHADAVSKVMSQIDGRGTAPECATTNAATFPPRNEPLWFMVDLEAKYRDDLHRPAGSSFVDVEGNVIWTQEYLRYRVSSCSHAVAQQKVFDQIDGRGVQADCTPAVVVAPTPNPTPTPTPLPPQSGTRIGATCNDGSSSNATGSGACSSHGGVRCWKYSDGSCRAS